jgi:hypothetical protein
VTTISDETGRKIRCEDGGNLHPRSVVKDVRKFAGPVPEIIKLRYKSGFIAGEYPAAGEPIG